MTYQELKKKSTEDLKKFHLHLLQTVRNLVVVSGYETPITYATKMQAKDVERALGRKLPSADAPCRVLFSLQDFQDYKSEAIDLSVKFQQNIGRVWIPVEPVPDPAIAAKAVNEAVFYILNKVESISTILLIDKILQQRR